MIEAPSGEIREREHVFPLRVYFEDTDAGGVVYYANYLRFAERARTEMLRVMGEEHSALLEGGEGIAFAVRRCEVDYLKPAVLDDRLTVHSSVIEAKGASVTVAQAVRRQDQELVRLLVVLVCMDLKTGRAVRIPEAVREKMSQLVN